MKRWIRREVKYDIFPFIIYTAAALIEKQRSKNNLILLQISNFEYLMELNILAGRGYSDITQVDL